MVAGMLPNFSEESRHYLPAIILDVVFRRIGAVRIHRFFLWRLCFAASRCDYLIQQESWCDMPMCG